MFTANSYTITETQKASEIPLLQWKFQIENGNTGEMIVSDPLLETEELADERAKAEFLKNSYSLNEINFKTYRTDLFIGQVINIKGVEYEIKEIKTKINRVSMITSIKGIRYE